MDVPLKIILPSGSSGERPARGRQALGDEIMAARLAAHGLVQRRVEDLVVGRGAQRRAQVGLVLLAEARVERPRCRSRARDCRFRRNYG